VYQHMHDRRIYQRGAVTVEIKGDWERYGDILLVAQEVMLVVWQVGEWAEKAM
jgi:hypothetical protein